MSTRSQVFLSYRSTQEDLALRLAHDLELAGLKVWIDQSKIKGSDLWRRAIEEGITECQTMIAVLSPEYLESDYCRRELSRADTLKRPVVPVLLKTIPPEKWPIELQGVQYIDFRPWHKARKNKERLYQEGFKELTQALENTGLILQPHQPTPLSGQSQPKRPWAKIITILGVIAAIVAFLANITTVWQGIEDVFDSSDTQEATQTLVTETATPEPESLFDGVKTPLSSEELADNMLKEALRIHVDSFADTPQAMAVAPFADNRMALWSYDVDGYLFAIDTATGSPLDIWSPPDGGDPRVYPLRPQISDTFRPSALHYDGVWLWIADSIGQQVVALDPLTLEKKAVWQLDGEPVDMVSIENTLWVALYDTGELAVAEFNRDTGEPTNVCARERIKVGDALSALVVDGRSAIWAAYGRGENGAIRSVGVRNCQLSDPIEFGAKPKQLLLRDRILWVVSDAGQLSEINLSGNRMPQAVELPDVWVDTVMDDGTYLWIGDSQESTLSVFDADHHTVRVTLSLDASPLSLDRFGAQTWVATNDDVVMQFILPDYIHPNLVDVAWAANALWLVDEEGYLCQLADLREDCTLLDLGGTPVAMSNASRLDGNALWLAISTGDVWLVDLEHRTTEKEYVLEWPALTLAEETGKYLWTANANTGMLVVIDLATGEQFNALSFSGAPPDVIAYDGTTMWFAYGGARKQVISVRYDRESRSFIEVGSSIALSDFPVDISMQNAFFAVTTQGRLAKINPITGSFFETYGLDQARNVLASDMRDHIWIASERNGFVYSSHD